MLKFNLLSQLPSSVQTRWFLQPSAKRLVRHLGCCIDGYAAPHNHEPRYATDAYPSRHILAQILPTKSVRAKR